MMPETVDDGVTFHPMDVDEEPATRKRKQVPTHLCPRRAPNSLWREKVAQWCYDVVDCISESRSVVYVAMNILDRFCASDSESVPVCKKTYEVAALAAIFLELQMNHLVSMSRGKVTMQDIVAIGTLIISTLSWEKTIETPAKYILKFLELIPMNASREKEMLLDSASYLTEIAVCDGTLSRSEPSSLAAAALLTSLEAYDRSRVKALSAALKQSESVDTNSNEIAGVIGRLQKVCGRAIINQIQQEGPHFIEDDDEESSSDQ